VNGCVVSSDVVRGDLSSTLVRQSGLRLPAMKHIFLFLKSSILAVGSTEHINRYRVPIPELKCPGFAADRIHPSRNDVRNKWIYISTPCPFINDVHIDKFTFTFTVI
jgi:hypothetical protein